MAELYPVTFHGDTIFCVEHDEQPYTPVRPIIENMGLDWASQSVKESPRSAMVRGLFLCLHASMYGLHFCGSRTHSLDGLCHGLIDHFGRSSQHTPLCREFFHLNSGGPASTEGVHELIHGNEDGFDVSHRLSPSGSA